MKLMTCPFCGGRPLIEEKSRGFVNGESTRVTYVRCSVCNARAPRFDPNDYDSRQALEMAVDAWNKRVEPHEVNVLTKHEKYVQKRQLES